MRPGRVEEVVEATNVTALVGILKMPEWYLGGWRGFLKAADVAALLGILKMPERYLVAWKDFR